MPRYARYQLWWSEQAQTYELSVDGLPSDHVFTADWLETIASFSFRSRDDEQYTVRKQTVQRGSTYWYGYRRLHGRLVKRYVGKTTDLFVTRLEEVARLFAGEPLSPPPPFEAARPPSPEALLLFSKLSPPRLPALLVERSALLARLDTSLSHTLTLLQTPAGFGKTTLVTQWIVERGTHVPFPRVAWLSLDAGDNDPLRFWRSLIMACQALEATVGQTALAHLSAVEEPPFQIPPLEMIITSFLNDLAQQIPDGLLILDDYHAIKEARIHEMLTFFIDHLPVTLRVLLLSRTEPPLPLLRWRAKGVLFELQRGDLRFSLAETATFLRQPLLPLLSDTALIQLDAILAGWAAGLRLLAHTLQGTRTALEVAQTLISLSDDSGNENLGTRPSQARQQILDYFVTEILRAQPEALQHFLLQTSVLSHLNASLCDAVTGEENSTARLEAVERTGLFLEVMDKEALHLPQVSREWYRYQALWASALRREATTHFGEEALRALSLRASHWYEQHAMAREAIEMTLRAHDLERAALLIEHADAHGQISEPHTLGRWLSPMPKVVLRAHPMLCWLAALSLQLLQEDPSVSAAGRERVEVLLRMAEEGWRNRGELPFLGLITAFYALSAWRESMFPHAVEYAQQALAQLADKEQDRRTRMFRGICLFIVGAAQMYAGRFGEARPSLLEAYACSLVDGDKHFTRSMLLLLGVCSYALGELHQAHEYYQQALSDARRQEDREVIAQALLGLANTAFEWNRLSATERQVHEAVALAREEDADLRDRAALQFALLSHARGQITSAAQQLVALRARLQMTSTPQAAQLLPNVHLWQARLALETGDLQHASRLRETLEREEHMAAEIFQARLRLSQNRPNAARQQLVCLLPETSEWRHTLEIQILLALAHAACQEGKLAQRHLRQALLLARSESLLRPFLAEGEPLAHLLRQLLSTLREPALRSYALTILHAFQFPDGEDAHKAASSESPLVESLSPQEQRVLKLLVAGRSNREIAQELVVSINTVKDHVKHLYRKLGVSTRLQASSAAHHLKLL
ncbi:MAG TPA: LuxR C-terminal-related transcriptional regulator [Ktedonosporobacter sp.]|nr:LuxR C-terminal-related transcriptional regulator [Ktedonosporobacter sp.]